MTSELPESALSPAMFDQRMAPAVGVLKDAVANSAFPGCAFGVTAGGETLLEGALGRFTYDNAAPQVAANTVFDVASLTKVVATTATAMILHQQARLDLETPVAELLPGFVVGRPPGTSARYVKLRHLLAHNSGLPGYVEFFRSLKTPAALFQACLELPLEAMPGERAEYSDPGFILLGKALEVILREPLCNWARREVFSPLNMISTGFNPARRWWAHIAPTEVDEGFRKRVIQGEVQDENAWVLNGAAGHAGLFSNVPDLLRFSEAILSAVRTNPPAEISKVRPFNPATVRLFAGRQTPEGSSRALGWDTPSGNSSAGRYFSADSIGHLGYSGCSIWLDLKDDMAVVLLTNRTWPDRANQAIREVRPAFHNAIRSAMMERVDGTLAVP